MKNDGGRPRPQIGSKEFAQQGAEAQRARHPASRTTAAARAASPGNLDNWLREVKAEFPDISDGDALTMAKARQSQHFRNVGAGRKAG